MNKTKLEVIRINEDVIATSSVCQHHDKPHFYSEINNGSSYLKGDYYDANSFSISIKVTAQATYNYFSPNADINSLPGKYYYRSGSLYYECTGYHSKYERD